MNEWMNDHTISKSPTHLFTECHMCTMHFIGHWEMEKYQGQ